jgi:S-DNA-T family DNA segregation ATPase FtsK/SpoIIIE
MKWRKYIMASGAQRTTKKSSGSTKKTGRAKGSTAKKTSTAKSAGKKANSNTKSYQIGDEILVLFSFAVAVILILSNFNLAGVVGTKIKWFMFGLLGIMEYIFPVMLVVTLLFLVSNREYTAVLRIKAAAVFVLMILLSAAWLRISDKPDITESSFTEFFTYSAGISGGGGFFGGLVCKILSPMGTFGSMVIILLLAVICIIVITERSFINGLAKVQKNGSRMVHAAKQDYDIYREYSNERHHKKADDDELSEEEYLKRRKEKKLKQLMENEKKVSRSSKKVRGVTSATKLPEREEEEYQDIDIHEITVDTERYDEYSDDIYEPKPVYDYEVESILAEEDDDYISPIEEETVSDDSTIMDVSERLKNIEQEHEVHEQTIYEDEAEQQTFEKEQTEAVQDEDFDTDSMEFPEDIEDDIKENIGEEISEQIEPDTKNVYKYEKPPVDLLSRPSGGGHTGQDRENKETALRLQQTLQNFGVRVTITDISCGPSVTRYELQPEQGVKVSKIVSLADDIKLNLAAADIRIEAPIPGKAAIGIEVPNKIAGSVSIRELVESEAFKKSESPITFAVGKDIAGKTIVTDIAKMPHLLIAGATGSGKSVCINTIIMSILYKADPEDVKMIMIDPKMVELRVYDGIPHLMIPVVIDPKKASGALNWAVNEMTDRYKKFAQLGVRDLKGYNAKIAKVETPEGVEPPKKMPQLVIIVDELADLMMVAPGEVEDAICRLAQLARAAGIHLVIATQRPSVNVITGLIKANVPSRIAFSVSSGVDSRTIIDMNGAEKLLGKGDMLFFPSGYPKPLRVQGAFVSDDEVTRVVDFLKEHSEEVVYDDKVTETITSTATQNAKSGSGERDPYFAEAGRFVIEKEKGSIGMLQRYYKVGFNRAARIMDQLADAKVVGQEIGTKPRKVLMTAEEFEEYLKNSN